MQGMRSFFRVNPPHKQLWNTAAQDTDARTCRVREFVV